MKRRDVLISLGAALAAPRIGRAQSQSTIKFVPFSDPAVLDPITTGNYAVRNQALMVFDMLYGIDANGVAQPQMAAGHVVEDDGRRWTITLRDGLRFHDGTPVLARDAVASLRRWSQRDPLGGALMAVTDELSAPTDRTVLFRLSRPFPLLPDALGKVLSTIAVIMPERLAATDPAKQVSEIIGSGPFKYVAAERMQGALNVYARNAEYVPRPDGAASLLAGPKIVHFDRVEWHTIPDPATASAALQKGEVDWWEQPTPDYIPLLKRQPNLKLEILDGNGTYTLVRWNELQPPFNNVKVRQAALAAISQSDALHVMAGDDTSMWQTDVGFFAPNSPMSSKVGLAAVKDPPDLDRARRLLKESGYNGEKVGLIDLTTVPHLSALSNVVGDAWQKIGLDVEMQPGDLAALLQKITNKGPVDKGGWSASPDGMAGMAAFNPIANVFMKANGPAGLYGWADIPQLLDLSTAWLRAAGDSERKEICRHIQEICFAELPYAPTGVLLRNTAYQKSLTGVQKNVPLFWNIRRV